MDAFSFVSKPEKQPFMVLIASGAGPAPYGQEHERDAGRHRATCARRLAVPYLHGSAICSVI